MKTSFKILSGSILLASAITFITACKKDSSSSGSTTTDNNGAASNMSAKGAASDNAYDDVFNLAVQTGYDKNLDNLMQKRSGGATLGYGFCANVTVSGSSFPITLKVDFGAGCTSNDGIQRSGSITYTFTGKLSTAGTTVSAQFDNYTVNGDTLSGTYSISNTTTNILSPTFTTTVTDGHIGYQNDTAYSFSGTKTAAVSSSTNTPGDVTSLIFTVTGNYSISNSFGESLTANVTTPLIKKVACAHIDTGVIAFTYTKGTASVSGTLDYGNGTCDANAVITIGSFTKNITLP
ncbi:MAG TPA: hypothetical protein VKT28_21210 [Puia sp.]|nr:hypothetical protein [Puia sp.]